MNAPYATTLGASVEQALETLVSDGDAAMLEELLEIFLSETPGHLQAMRRAAAREDLRSLERAAHSLLSTSATFGLETMRTLAKAIEDYAASGRVDRPAIERYAMAFEQARPELERLRAVAKRAS